MKSLSPRKMVTSLAMAIAVMIGTAVPTSAATTYFANGGSTWQQGGTPAYWNTASGYGWCGNFSPTSICGSSLRYMHWTYSGGTIQDNVGIWGYPLTSYPVTIYTFVPSNYASTSCAKYGGVRLSGNNYVGYTGICVNQAIYSNQWIKTMSSGVTVTNPQYTALGDNTNDYPLYSRFVGYDEIKWVY